MLLYLVTMMVDWSECQRTLGLSFRHEPLLEEALVHSSYLNEHRGCGAASNERLEFLGDAILDFVLTVRLYKEFPELDEGRLTEIRALLVCRDALADLASSLGLGEWLLLGQGEDAGGGRTKASNLANAMEALIGALYLDQGLVKARQFILRQFRRRLAQIKSGRTALNYKALVQELVQGQRRPTPVYRLIEAAGPDHRKRFTVEITVAGDVLGRGIGMNKKGAESQAARAAWKRLRCNHG